MTNPYFLVFVGGGLGSVMRFATYYAARLWLPPNFPWGPMAVNVLGGSRRGDRLCCGLLLLAIGGVVAGMSAVRVVA